MTNYEFTKAEQAWLAEQKRKWLGRNRKLVAQSQQHRLVRMKAKAKEQLTKEETDLWAYLRRNPNLLTIRQILEREDEKLRDFLRQSPVVRAHINRRKTSGRVPS
jgi:hypothetical protein